MMRPHAAGLALAAVLLTTIGTGCEAEEKGGRFRNESGLTVSQLAALLEEVRQADRKQQPSACRPTGEAAPSSQTSTWLAGSNPEKIVRAKKGAPYALDPRDIELTVDIGRKDAWLIVTVRVQSNHCIGYSLSTMYVDPIRG
jgi:hypothetical protein